MAAIVVYKAEYTFINASQYEVKNLEELSRTPLNDLNKASILNKAKEIANFNNAEIKTIVAIHRISASGNGTPKVCKGENMVMEG